MNKNRLNRLEQVFLPPSSDEPKDPLLLGGTVEDKRA
jgi:hypothetical protein